MFDTIKELMADVIKTIKKAFAVFITAVEVVLIYTLPFISAAQIIAAIASGQIFLLPFLFAMLYFQVKCFMAFRKVTVNEFYMSICKGLGVDIVPSETTVTA